MSGKIRWIHSQQWDDVEFSRLSVEARLLAIAVRNFADDFGVFEFAPLKLRRWVFPFDDVNIDQVASELIDADVIQAFDLGGKTYASIRNFLTYQSPDRPMAYHPLPTTASEKVRVLSHVGIKNVSEAWLKRAKVKKKSLADLSWRDAILPLVGGSLSVDDFVAQACFRLSGGLPDQKSNKAVGRPKQDSSPGIPIFRPLASDEIQPTQKEPSKRKRQEPTNRQRARMPYTFDDVRESYNRIVAGIRHPAMYTPPSKKRHAVSPGTEKNIRARFQRHPDVLGDLDKLERFFVDITRSRFLMGLIAPKPDVKVPWNLTLDWIFCASNFDKIIEGKYHKPNSFMPLGAAPWDQQGAACNS